MKPVKPSVPKVLITTDKPKIPATIVKTAEGIATKQEQVHLVQEKVNGINGDIMVILTSHSPIDILMVF